MLWALALLGVFPAALVLNDANESDADEPSESLATDDALEGLGDIGAADASSDATDAVLGDGAVSSEDASAEDGATDTYDVDTDGGETVLDDFVIGEHSLMLHMSDDAAGEFSVEAEVDEDGAEIGMSLSYFDGEQETTIIFLGLSEVPVDDIFVSLEAPEAGERDTLRLEDVADADALLPNDPDEAEIAALGELDGVEAMLSDDEEPEIATAPYGGDDVLEPNDDTENAVITDHVMPEDGGTLVLADDPMESGSDAEFISVEGVTTLDTEDVLHIVTGSDASDIIAAGDDAAIVNAGAGDDTLYAGDGTSILSGEAGNDTLNGGGSDRSSYILDGGDGDDTITGGGADELIIGGTGADTLSGGAGKDTLVIDADDTVSGGAGADTFMISDDADAGGASYSEVSDFEAGRDILHVTVTSEDSVEDLTIVVEPTEDGTSSHVLVNGDVVAVLTGTPTATLDDVVVEAAA